VRLSILRERASPSSGLVGSARILRADNGAEVTCEDLLRTGERPLVWALDERKRLAARSVTDVSPVGQQATLTVRLASGRQLEATTGSQFATLTGWKPFGALGIDDPSIPASGYASAATPLSGCCPKRACWPQDW
jgi:hypothetical protein